MKQSIYNKRYITRVTLEAAAPLSVGTGVSDVLTDALVARDINGLPYIPGSSIAGVLRHSIGDDNKTDSIFGFQQDKQGCGSRIIFTDAVLLDEDGTPQDGLMTTAKSDFLSHYDTLPIRQHVCINDFGSAVKGGKFDEQVVYQGTRFIFEMEMVDNGGSEKRFLEVLDHIYSPFFRLGGGTRNGFGSMKIIDVQYRSLDLTNPKDLEMYVTKSSSLQQLWSGFEPFKLKSTQQGSWHEYVLELKPMDFFLFSSGFDDDEADITPVTETRVIWNQNKKGEFANESILIPATSVKGALAHRVAYHWNRIKGNTIESGKGKVGGKNDAVIALFGSSGKDSETISQGKVLLSDVIIDESNSKLFNHVTIDRITGGTIDGHLFTEKVIDGHGMVFKLTLLVENKILQENPDAKKALEFSLEDLCLGMLPLGNGVNRGHGIFTGKIIKGFENDGNQ